MLASSFALCPVLVTCRGDCKAPAEQLHIFTDAVLRVNGDDDSGCSASGLSLGL